MGDFITDMVFSFFLVIYLLYRIWPVSVFDETKLYHPISKTAAQLSCHYINLVSTFNATS
jgi:hypothetical protein